jgi:NAD(P)H-quinone oxidoreductase subunit 5
MAAMNPPAHIPALALGAACLPAALLLLPRSPGNGRRTAAVGALLAMASFVLALLTGILATTSGPFHPDLGGIGPVRFSLHLDALTTVMLILVSFLGAVVTQFTVNYLNGDPRQNVFAGRLGATVTAVLLLVVSGNLAVFVAAWITTSLCLHRLLTFYPDRPGAQAAARKKFLTSRMADACMITATVLVWQRFGTLEFSGLFAAATELARLGTSPDPAILTIAFLLVSAALLKSAQFPFHSWLPDTLETPTPVSALMHAGIINAGGFLIIRLSPLVSLVPAALTTLAVVGAITAVFASLVMMTQTSIKRALAWSTISQMGFMMLQCGLGAFALAVVHLVAHSLYKSYAFLSSGSVVSLTRAAWQPTGWPSAHPGLVTVILALAGGITFGVGHLFGHQFPEDPGLLVLSSIFVMALAFLLWNLWNTRFPARLATLGILLAVGASAAWFGVHEIASRLFHAVLPTYTPDRSLPELVLLAAIPLTFLAVLVFQGSLPSLASRLAARRLYVHASNGFYLGTLAHRIAASFFPAR